MQCLSESLKIILGKNVWEEDRRKTGWKVGVSVCSVNMEERDAMLITITHLNGGRFRQKGKTEGRTLSLSLS